MNREEAKTTMSKLIDVFRKEYPSGAFAVLHADADGHSLINKIYDAHEAELKTKDERIEAQSSVIIACQNAILQKDERITELEAKLDGLSGYCRKQIEHFNSKDSRSDYDWGLRDRTITILDKLDEGKEQ